MASLNEESVQDIAAEGQEVELTPEQKTTQLAQLMSEGRRELRAGNFEKAGEKFGEAAEFTDRHYGPFAAETFEPNFMYGRALVELSVVESDLFKNALVNILKKEDGDQEMEEKDGNESMTEEEKEDVRDLVAENAEEEEKKETEGTEEEEKKDDEAKRDEAGEESKVKNEEEKESSDEIAAGGSKEEGKMEEDSDENEEKEDGDEEEEEEDLDNNQLAWEALEVAAKIADKMMMEEEGGSSEWKRKKADVFVQLAQCAANDEKYEMALSDLVRARDLMAEIETETKKGDRLTAEIYFHEGRINRLRNEFALAEESFNKATAVMETILNGVKTEAGQSPTDVQKEEIHEMEEIIKDFKERAEDCKGSEVQKKMMATLAEKDKADQPSILTTSNANSDPTANDISGLVRKKRAHDDSDMEGAPKRGKSEEAEEKGEENIAV